MTTKLTAKLQSLEIPDFQNYEQLEAFAQKHRLSIADISEETKRRLRSVGLVTEEVKETVIRPPIKIPDYKNMVGEELCHAHGHPIKMYTSRGGIRTYSDNECSSDDDPDLTPVSDVESVASSKSAKKLGIVNKKTGKPIKPKVLIDEDDVDDRKNDKAYQGYAVTDYEMDIDFWQREWETDKVTYIVVGEETCPKTKVLHWQCFIYYNNKRKWSAIQKKMKPRHFGQIYSTPGDNSRYCKKGDQSKAEYRSLGRNGPNYGLNAKLILEVGECPMQGKRTDLEEVYEKVKKKEITTMAELAAENISTYCQYGKPIRNLIDELAEPRCWKTEVYCVVGKGGVGKSRLVRKLDPSVKTLSICGDIKSPFVMGYKKRPEVVMFEEFDWNCCSQEWWLQLCDRYEMVVNIKGDESNWAPRKIYFTANNHPSTWWDGWNRQVERRFTEIIETECDFEPADLKPKLTRIKLDLDGNILSREDMTPSNVVPTTLDEALSVDKAKVEDGYTKSV